MLLQKIIDNFRHVELKIRVGEILDILRGNLEWNKRMEETVLEMKKISEKIEKDLRKLSVNTYNQGKPGSKYVEEVIEKLGLRSVAGDYNYCRIGREYDGGYLMIDDFSECTAAYSFGINDDVSWDMDMAKKGIDVYMYDPTIEGLPEQCDKFHFFKIGISGAENDLAFPCRTLSEFLMENGHLDNRHMILKIDVEGSEWDAFHDIDPVLLEKFDQMVVEMHCLNDQHYYSRVLKSLDNINKTHQAVHIHANNFCTGVMCNGKFLPDVLEVTYLNRSKYDFGPYSGELPSALDMPNDFECPDIYLGRQFAGK